ncbi:phasin family protein [Oceanibaculum pacificum]|uniref:Phasin domain-containing protein n=1 Tax=Oceanibaculum pacificum TaxID=580166 RepID=A0A154VSM7_9PROT|nr:phasin family protein [Oceanibaculum pacificum]KZD04276.1 hypothetical protein AUP43_12290 [Oceanibaculum pacificum]
MTTTTKKTTAAQDAAIKQVETMVAAGKQTLESAMKSGNDAATKGYEQALGLTKEHVAKQSDAFFKGYDTLTSYNKQNLDAITASGAIVTKGVEDISKTWFGFTQSSVEQATETMQALMGCKTLRDVVELQNGFAKTSFDQLIAESAKLSEMTIKVTNDAIEPIKARMNSGVELMMKPLAA